MDSLSDYDYDLPKDRIAQSPIEPRENAKLMVIQKDPIRSLPRTLIRDRDDDGNVHQHIRDFPSYLRPSDVLVLNNTKVFKARLMGRLNKSDNQGKPIELLLIRPQGTYWLVLAKPGKSIHKGNSIKIEHNFSATVIEKNTDGSIVVDFNLSPAKTIKMADMYGLVPVPPYINILPDAKDYQTVYAKVVGSVAAPTAGFHITSSLLQKIKNMGVTIVEITLHVGLGTFQPIRTDDISNHHMHSEWVEISKKSADTINSAKSEGRRIIAVGTTTTRALEGVAEKKMHNAPFGKTQDKQCTMRNKEVIQPYSGDVNLFITPGFQFKIIDGLLTNFHLPKTTLLLLVSAFAASGLSGSVDKNGRQRILAAYREAIKNNYRFYSFGDAMIII